MFVSSVISLLIRVVPGLMAISTRFDTSPLEGVCRYEAK